ncbi:MAG: ATP-binding protein [Wenzhouxiangella sp.]|jgi:signal transduction histidine kinase/ligand-binding sensor domain-containing protein|nr:ATP-binding protein [Wenzhouxiangella sp.]
MLEGLPDPGVEAFVQDRFGYVWIGTRAGLVRHEGDRLRLMPRMPSEPNALPAQNIMALHAHSDGMVWASVEGHGLIEIGPDLMIRERLKPASLGGPLIDSNVWSMVEDCEGRLWMAFAQGGVSVFDPQTESVQHFEQNEEFGLSPHGFQTHLMMDGRCRIWLIQTARISVLDPSTQPTGFQPVFDASSGGSRDVFIHGWTSDDDEVYVSRGMDLIRLTPGDGPVENGRVDFIHTAPGLITGIGAFADGRMFLTTRAGLEVLDPVSGQSHLIQPRPDLPDSLPAPTLNGAHLLDAEGGLWLSVHREGLVYLAPNHSAFSRLPGLDTNPPTAGEHIGSISPASDRNHFWVTSDADEFRLNVASGERTNISEIYPALAASDSSLPAADALLETEVGLLLAFGQSLLILRDGSDQFEPFVALEELMPDQITALHPTPESTVWISMRSGDLVSLDLLTGLSHRYGPDELPPFHWPERGLLKLAFGPGDQLWVAGSSDVYRYDQNDGFLRTLELDAGPIRSLVWDEGALWVGSDFELHRYTLSQDGLLLSDRYEIGGLTERTTLLNIVPAPAPDDTLWLILRSGVASLNLLSGHFKTFSRADGLALSEFSREATTLLEDGRILLGGTEGLVTIDPQKLRLEPMDPPVHLRALNAGDRRIPLTPGPRSPLNLDWDENSVRFEFSALTYVAPERVQYRVRLNGWDDDWLELGRQSSLYYSNLRPGQYRFSVQAAGPDGRWGNGGDQLTISIAPPPWRSPLAWTAYAIAFVLMMAVAGAQFNQVRLRRRELQEVQQKRRLAEDQRQLIQRLNRDLNPVALARCVAEEIQRLSGAAAVTLGFLHDLMPDELVNVDGPIELSREEWLRHLEQVDGLKEQTVDLKADDEVIARVLLQAAPSGFKPDYQRPLGLLMDVAGQALQNSVLLQQVRLLADQAEHASRAKSEFLATMSHEIRTPLHGLLGMAELLNDGAGQQAPRDLLNTLKASGQQLQRIIDDVLDISKIEAGRMQLLAEPFETMPLLEQVIDLHASSAAKKRLDLRLRVSGAFPLLACGDAGRLAQILGNLVNNAIKFTPSGSVELTAEVASSGELCFGVSDTGPGIPADQVTRLFQPFSQLDSTVTREHSGSGLGLAISRRLADGMGGALRLRRSSLAGSVFELRLPATGTASPPSLTRLLSGVELIALVRAPTYRILMRAAGRWGFALRRGNGIAPHSGALVLFDGQDPGLAVEAMRWHSLGCRLLELNASFNDPSGHHKDRLTGIRWPLTESRLLAAMLDQVV